MRFLVDEDFDNDVLRGLLRRLPALDVVRVQDVGLAGASDSSILARAGQDGRVVLTHDVSTMTRQAYSRAASGVPMPGLFAVSQDLPIGRAIEDLLLLAECSYEGEWEGQVRYLPL
ncbi:MAG: DUF5615 family PIN-like protein [Planctomycetes bacterium]|nr:DUF5615 family PIN-like protein [Planctomycetota bacterium]